MRFIFPILFLLIGAKAAISQNTRINESNNIGWYNYFGSWAVSKLWSAHTEYQWRRTDYVSNWQQGLLRVGLNYQLNPNILFRSGYAWIETFAYGETPINGMGKDFTEHRAFQMALITNPVGKVVFSHRFMQEQRWVGRYSSRELSREDEFVFLNRTRYMFRMQVPIFQNCSKAPYLALYDEIFIGYGENVIENIFDQNRLGFLIGATVNKNLKIEGGYLYQVLQLGREEGGRNVFQNNHGIIVNLLFAGKLREFE